MAEVVINGSVYEIEAYADRDADNPRDFDCNGVSFYLWGSHNTTGIDELADADRAGEVLQTLLDKYGQYDLDPIIRIFNRWASFTGDNTLLFTGSAHGYSQSDWREYLALVPNFAPGTYGDLTPEGLVTLEAEVYRQWADGDVSVVIIHAPNGDEIAACGGIYENDIEAWIEQELPVNLTKETV